jgi:uncharacterized protein (DUF983 family)
MNTPKACPGWEKFKNLSSFECKCPLCGKDFEIFSDEFDKEHYCRSCHEKIDFTKCTLSASGHSI